MIDGGEYLQDVANVTTRRLAAVTQPALDAEFVFSGALDGGVGAAVSALTAVRKSQGT